MSGSHFSSAKTSGLVNSDKSSSNTTLVDSDACSVASSQNFRVLDAHASLSEQDIRDNNKLVKNLVGPIMAKLQHKLVRSGLSQSAASEAVAAISTGSQDAASVIRLSKLYNRHLLPTVGDLEKFSPQLNNAFSFACRSAAMAVIDAADAAPRPQDAAVVAIVAAATIADIVNTPAGGCTEKWASLQFAVAARIAATVQELASTIAVRAEIADLYLDEIVAGLPKRFVLMPESLGQRLSRRVGNVVRRLAGRLH